MSGPLAPEPFTREGLLKHLIEFVSSDNQVCSILLSSEGLRLNNLVVNKCGQQSLLLEVACVRGRWIMYRRRYTALNKIHKRDN
jgi:hypothetical protein